MTAIGYGYMVTNTVFNFRCAAKDGISTASGSC
jgi:hypothetical protein